MRPVLIGRSNFLTLPVFNVMKLHSTLLALIISSLFAPPAQGDTGGLSLDAGTISGVISGTGGLTKVSSGILILSGANTYTGPTLIEAGTLALNGSLSSNVVTVSSCATLINSAGGLSATSTLINNGIILQNTANTIAALINTGSINGSTTLTTATYALNNGSIINANLGSGSLTSNGSVTLNGSSAATSFYVQSGSTSLGSAGRLLNSSVVTIDALATLKMGADEKIGTLAGSGNLQISGGRLTVDTGNFSGIISGSGGLSKESSENLILSGANTFTGSTFVNNGGLEVAGSMAGSSIVTASGSTFTADVGSSIYTDSLTISGILATRDSSCLNYLTLAGTGFIDSTGSGFVNRAGATVRGGLTFGGNFTNQGNFAPGNSPGLTTIGGNYTESGTLHTELETTTPITGHDQVRVGGNVSLLPGSSLVVETYNNVLPLRGAIYQVIAGSLGGLKPVTGIFSTVRFDADGASGSGVPVINAAVLFDQATGRLIATGLNGPTSTFSDLGSTANQRQLVGSIFNNATSMIGPNQINSSTAAGALALQLIAAPGSLTIKLADLTPEVYGSIADYAMASDLAVTHLLHDRVTNLRSMPGGGPDDMALFSGIMQHNFDNADHVAIDRTDCYVGGDYSVARNMTLGLLATYNNGDFSTSSGRGDMSGMGADAYIKTRLLSVAALNARLGYSSYHSDLRRNTTDTIQAFGSTNSSVLTGSLGLSCLGGQWGELSLVPRVDLTYSNATVNGFTETGANDSFVLDAYGAERLCAELGGSLVWSTKLDGHILSIEMDSSIEQALIDHKANQQATMVSTPSVSFNQSFASAPLSSINVGLRVAYGINRSTSIYAGYEGRVCGDSSGNANLGLRVCF